MILKDYVLKKNIIYKVLKLLKITLLASCSFYSESNDTEAIGELQSNYIESSTDSIANEKNLEKILNLEQYQFPKNEKENVIKKIIQRFNENEKYINQIGPIVAIFSQKIHKDIQKTEPIDQFGINKQNFQEKQNFKIDYMLSNNLFRRLFYSSLNYDEDKIKKLVKILAQLSSSNGYHYRLIGLFLWTGFKIQEAFEKAINLLNKDAQRRLLFNFKTKTVKDVQKNFEKLIQKRNAWITTIETLLREYNMYPNVRADSIVLSEFVRNGYEDKLSSDESMQILLIDIRTLLRACCDHIHY